MEHSELSAGLRAGLLLHRSGFRFTHSLGQNFLLDDELVERMVEAAGVQAGERILEVGPGAGVMTCHMLDRGAQVTSVELDEGLRPILDEMLASYEGARVIYADALKLNPGELFGDSPFRVVANIPYYITSDLVTRLLRAQVKPTSVTALVQREAFERMSARPGGKSWCALAATVSYFGRCQALMDVGREHFTPPPHVDSVLMRIDLYGEGEKPVSARDEKKLLSLIDAAFFMRRKTFANNLCAVFSVPRPQAEALLTSVGLDAKVRGEAVPLETLCALADRM